MYLLFFDTSETIAVCYFRDSKKEKRKKKATRIKNRRATVPTTKGILVMGQLGF